MKKVLTTVGTSIFTNYMSDDVCKAYDKDYEGIKTEFRQLEKESCNEYEKNTRYINKIKNIICNLWLKGIHKNSNKEWEVCDNELNIDSCAEIKSIIKIYEENKDLEICLITTDTILSKVAAEIIEYFFKEMFRGINIIGIYSVDGLQINDYKEFSKKGLFNLIELISTLSGIKENGVATDVLINISGGYKAIIPYLTIYGQLYNMPLVYIYEDSDDLINIAKLPIQYDLDFVEQNFYYLNNPKLFMNNSEIMEELKDLQLIKYNPTNKKCETTIIYKLLYDYITKKSTVSKNVLGYFMEYKLYEYFIQNPFNGYKYIFHSVREDWLKDLEIDLILSKDNKKIYKDFIACEVKSIAILFSKDDDDKPLKKLCDKVRNQLKLFHKNGYIPSEYYLYLYSSKLYTSKDIKRNSFLINQVKKVKDIIDNMDKNIKFKAFIVNYVYDKPDKINFNDIRQLKNQYNIKNVYKFENPYQFFMGYHLKDTDIQIINL
ncbi:hypothetical protein PQ689_04980 [Thermoanaerobacterium thermosaccharolyticum]|uniref:hypothetical protein n=1 Tax=Thermoanaerobacterium thermosaccharolyticum TaxID=1517 RepID=UPI003DA924AE